MIFQSLSLTSFAWLGTLPAGFQAVFQIFLHPSDAAGKSAGKPFLLSAASCLRKNGSAGRQSRPCGMTQREHPLQSCNYLSLRGRCAAKGQRVTEIVLSGSAIRPSIGTTFRPHRRGAPSAARCARNFSRNRTPIHQPVHRSDPRGDRKTSSVTAYGRGKTDEVLALRYIFLVLCLRCLGVKLL